MIRKFLIAAMFMTFLSATTLVFAEDVYITPNGTKYHKAMCRLVKNKANVTKLDEKEAIEEHYSPCKRCFEQDLDPAGSQDAKGKK